MKMLTPTLTVTSALLLVSANRVMQVQKERRNALIAAGRGNHRAGCRRGARLKRQARPRRPTRSRTFRRRGSPP